MPSIMFTYCCSLVIQKGKGPSIISGTKYLMGEVKAI